MSEYDSGDLPVEQHYYLSGYDFSITITRLSDEHITAVSASMVHNGQRTVHGIELEENAQIESWCVEATETSAKVYVNTKPVSPLIQGSLNVSSGHVLSTTETGDTIYTTEVEESLEYVRLNDPDTLIFASDTSGSTASISNYQTKDGKKRKLSGVGTALTRQLTYNGKTVYYALYGTIWGSPASAYAKDVPATTNIARTEEGEQYSIDACVAWTIKYVVDADADKLLVAEFEIDLSPEPGPEPPDPGDNWEEPESTGDPDYTLKVKIIGALSGRHNDPLHDASLSFVPTDQISVKGYGGGGDGGHGGGGGAGASTIIVRRFVTDKAGSIEVTAISKRHGYGSGGGKGGRGGDGCILVFY